MAEHTYPFIVSQRDYRESEKGTPAFGWQDSSAIPSSGGGNRMVRRFYAEAIKHGT
jgi:hypothetical protein